MPDRQWLNVRIEANTAADLVAMTKRMRELDGVASDEAFDTRLRDAEMALTSALRGAGWTPVPGGWVQAERTRRG